MLQSGSKRKKKRETTEDGPLRVETCSVNQTNKKFVALTAKFVLLVVLTEQDANYKKYSTGT
jgi:hypothetical protein